jgi:hypothetical protein
MSNRLGFIAGLVVLVGWLAFSAVSVVADGKKPQLVQSITQALQGDDQKVSLPPQWSDDMVLQRDVPIPISGTSEPDKEITILFGDQNKVTTADHRGNWHATLDPMPPSAEPRDLRVIPGCMKCSAEIRNLLVGDVWLCGGRSTTPAAPAAPAADSATIRVIALTVGRDNSAKSERGWDECKGAVAASLPPMVRAFAEALQADQSVPVGVILCPPAANRAAILPAVALPDIVSFPIRGALWPVGASVLQDQAGTFGVAAPIQRWRKASGQTDLPILLFPEAGSVAQDQAASWSREISLLPHAQLKLLGDKDPVAIGNALAQEALKLTSRTSP